MRRATYVVMAAALAVPVLMGSTGASATVPAPAPAPAPAPVPLGGEPLQYQVAAVIDDGDNTPIGRGLNETGTVVGWEGFPVKAFIWNEATGRTKLPALPGQTHRLASDVNDAGVVVGHSGYQSIENPQHAVRWVDGVPEDLGVPPGGFDSHAEAINEAGMIVGETTVASGATHAFVWTEEDGMIDITPNSPPSQLAYAYDVNESGQVTGYANSRAYIWEDGDFTDLGVPAGYAYSFAFAINDEGVVAAHVTSASGDTERVARWTPGVGWEVLGGVGELNVSWGINNDGTIVGEGRPTAGLERGFVYIEGTGLLSLTELLTTDVWFILSAHDVDDAGRIVALGANREVGGTATLLLEPVRPGMADENLRVQLRGSPDPSAAVAKLRVVDESGDPVRRALVDGTWSRNGEVVNESDTDRTNRKGRAELKQQFDGLASGEVVEFCITTITHDDFEYDPPSEPSCASAVVP
jgi:probable HAF family extracellular repeat protein